MSWVGRCRPTSPHLCPIELNVILYTRIQESCIPLDECFALLLLLIILDYVKSSRDKCVLIVHPHIGQKINDLVAFPANVLEYDGPVSVEHLFNSCQSGFESPTVSNFMRMCPIEELIGHVDEDSGVTFYHQRMKAMSLGKE